ncbi:MAG TPA: sterol desaturase family protein [Acidimicrobiales bacterium]|jgi:beta-carotene 3-hydroxylase
MIEFVATAAVSFITMEPVSYLMHRFVMHGAGWPVHADHHSAGGGGFERNDVFPASFSLFAASLFAAGAAGAGALFVAAGVGMTVYGVAYLYVHEVCIHERLAVGPGRRRYVAWLRAMHRIHHLYGGEPYGMLLPVVPRELRRRAHDDDRDPFLRACSTREIRSRL